MAPLTSNPSMMFSAKRLSVFLLTTVSCVAAAEKSTSHHLRRFEPELESDLFAEDAIFWGREMQASSSMIPPKRHNCEDGCNLDYGPICGADGITYYNECLAVCQGVDVHKHEACPGDSNTARMMDDTHDGDSFVDLETIERFHSENFKFVGVRKLVPFKGDKMQVTNEDFNEPTSQPEQGKIRVSRVSYDGCEYIKEAETTEGLLSKGEFPPSAAKLEDGDDAGRSLGVIGIDTRKKILNTRQYPYRYVGQIIYDKDGDRTVDGRCSGTIISRDSVLTAAKCVHQGSGGGWYENVDFSPARYRNPDGKPVNPYGIFSWDFATTYTRWTTDGTLAYNIAVVKYKPRLGTIYFDTYIGYAGLREASWNSPSLALTSITGYPGDKNRFEMWTSGICSEGYYQYPESAVFLVKHFCDTYKGMSGSASMDASGYISAVLSHRVRVVATDETLYNGSVLLNGIHYQNVLKWSGRTQDA